MKINIIAVIIFFCILQITFVNPAGARLEIVDFFSDFTSSEVTIRSSQDFKGRAVFELMYGEKIEESQEIPFEIGTGEQLSKVIIWQGRPQHDYYTARVSLYNETTLQNRSSYQVSYGTVTMPSFQVVDFSPSNKGMQVLLRSFNPGVVDIEIELLDKNDIVYTETTEDLSLTTNTELKIDWPFLLANDRKYTVRAKIFSHRLNALPLINTYIADFVSSEDVEILRDDVEVDEYGASVTLRGKSQVPFDGFIDITARNRVTNETKTYRQQMEEILIFAKEDTAGIVWKDLQPGTYDIEIRAINKENISLDKYETVLRIPQDPVLTGISSPEKNIPGFSGLVLIIVILLVSTRIKRGE